MAHAATPTWLPLDRWFEIIGIHPFHGNQLHSDTYLPNASVKCGLHWYQYAWGNADRISREDLAIAIRQAEEAISNEVGYNLLPDWTPTDPDYGEPERILFDRPSVPELYSGWGTDVRGKMRSIKLSRGHIIEGGVRTKVGIETATITRSDEDGDTYEETCTVSVGTAVTDPDELRVYFPGEDAADEWEIKPIDVSISGAVATIKFKIWQVVDPDKTQGLNPSSIDAETPGNFLTTVDVYRVYNDEQTQVQFLFEEDGDICPCNSANCVACQFDTQWGCFYNRDARLGLISPSPGDWDSDDSQFDWEDWTACRAPDQVRVYYYSGWRDPRGSRPKTKMDPYWEQAVAYYAAALLDKAGCDCSNAFEFIYKWQKDIAHSGKEQGAYSALFSQLANRLGTSRGAMFAISRIQQPGRRLGGR